MSSKRGYKVVVVGIRCCNFLCFVPHLFLHVFNDSGFNGFNGLGFVFGDRAACIYLSFLETLEPCFLTTV